MTTLELEIRGMHCASCGMLIDDAVEELPGVIRVCTDSRAERTIVELDGTGADAGQVIAAIATAGYGARVLRR